MIQGKLQILLDKGELDQIRYGHTMNEVRQKLGKEDYLLGKPDDSHKILRYQHLEIFFFEGILYAYKFNFLDNSPAFPESLGLDLSVFRHNQSIYDIIKLFQTSGIGWQVYQKQSNHSFVTIRTSGGALFTFDLEYQEFRDITFDENHVQDLINL